MPFPAYKNVSANTIIPGQPVFQAYDSGGNAFNASGGVNSAFPLIQDGALAFPEQYLGLNDASGSVAAGASGTFASGTLMLTTGQWDTLTGQSGGLTPGYVYYVTKLNGPWLSKAPIFGPGDWQIPVGIAKSTTDMMLVPVSVVNRADKNLIDGLSANPLAAAISAGAAVYAPTHGRFDLGKADALATSQLAGLSLSGTIAAADTEIQVQSSGNVFLTTAQWDAPPDNRAA